MNELIKKFPQWASVFENPAGKISSLFNKADWRTIGKLIDASLDWEIQMLLFKNLYDAPSTGEKRKMQVSVIEKAKSSDMIALAIHVFSQAYAVNMTDLLKLMIEKADSETLDWLVRTTFSKPHTKDMVDLLELLIEKADIGTLQDMDHRVFSQPHTEDSKYDVLKRAIAIRDFASRKKFLDENYVHQDAAARVSRFGLSRGFSHHSKAGMCESRFL